MDLVLLGALYAPCMRIDRELFRGLVDDRRMENTSGCCVRRDESGCVHINVYTVLTNRVRALKSTLGQLKKFTSHL